MVCPYEIGVPGQTWEMFSASKAALRVGKKFCFMLTPILELKEEGKILPPHIYSREESCQLL
jgi:hypothetical protein